MSHNISFSGAVGPECIFFSFFNMKTNTNNFTVTVCEADSTTSMESDSTVCYDESDQNDSDNDSLSSGPMFLEDTHDTDNELPQTECGNVEGPGAILSFFPTSEAAAPAAALATENYSDSNSNKCKCPQDNKVFFFSLLLFF